MKRTKERLTVAAVRNAKVRPKADGTPRAHGLDMIPDGGGLYLQVRATEAMGRDGRIRPATTKSWLFRFVSPVSGKTRDMGLGAVDEAEFDLEALEAVREAARVQRAIVKDKKKPQDPIDVRDAERAADRVKAAKLVTFKEAAEAYVEKKRGKWRSGKHSDQWLNTLTTYAFPLIGSLPVQAIDTGLIVKILEAKQPDGKSLWDSKTTTAARLLGRIESILGAATVAGHRTGDNPAKWTGHLEEIFSGKAPSKPQPKLPYAEVPAFMVDLAAQPGDAKKALALTILCATRTNETLKARIGEIDLMAKVWTIPADRTKRAREFRVPLTDAAIEILRPFCGGINDPRRFLFQGRDVAKAMSGGAMSELVKRMHRAEVKEGRKGWIDPKRTDKNGNPKVATVHGFRGSFRDWAGASGIPRELAELCMNHRIGDATEQAYFTDDLLERRRNVMKAWAAYALGEAPGKNVVTLERETA